MSLRCSGNTQNYFFLPSIPSILSLPRTICNTSFNNEITFVFCSQIFLVFNDVSGPAAFLIFPGYVWGRGDLIWICFVLFSVLEVEIKAQWVVSDNCWYQNKI